MILLDTDVMIDVLRKHAPAVAWLQASPTDFWYLLPGADVSVTNWSLMLSARNTLSRFHQPLLEK